MRLFVAVHIPDEIREKLGALGIEVKRHGEGIVPVKSGNMHLTLKFIGESDRADEIVKRLREVPFAAFSCTVKGVGVFPTPQYVRVVWAGMESGDALESLAKDVGGVLRGLGGDERFSAHVTIARVKRKVDLTDFLQKHRDEDFGTFTVPGFDLMESVLGKPGGPEYRVVAHFPFGSQS